LNRVPEVRDFIYGDLSLVWERAEFKKIHEEPPTAVFYNEEGEEVDSVKLEGMQRLELFHMMDSRGMERKHPYKKKDDKKKQEL